MWIESTILMVMAAKVISKFLLDIEKPANLSLHHAIQTSRMFRFNKWKTINATTETQYVGAFEFDCEFIFFVNPTEFWLCTAFNALSKCMDDYVSNYTHNSRWNLHQIVFLCYSMIPKKMSTFIWFCTQHLIWYTTRP